MLDKALIVGDFNIDVDNTNYALGLAFTDLINSFGVKQNVTGPTHRFNHITDINYMAPRYRPVVLGGIPVHTEYRCLFFLRYEFLKYRNTGVI